jgi:predicted DNA-binding protein (MmcQ/YjbR family)
MDGEQLQRLARDRAETLPGSGCSFPFGPETEVYKVRGKVFMLHHELRGDPIVTLKAHPEDVRALVQSRTDVTPGYHMNKKHWITLGPGGTLAPDEVEELVAEAYLLIVESLPRARRPVDPAMFGRPRQ